MRGVVLTGHGGYDCLVERDDLERPVAGPGEVLVQVGASAVNNTDINTRIGWYSGGGWTGSFTFPRVQGIDACGRIVAVGQGVETSRLGERVLIEPCWREPGAALASAIFFGSEVDGAFAEFTVVPGRHAHRVDSPLSDTELASFPCSYSTAENMLTRAGVVHGDRVLVTGASGGVGSAAVQLAAARGAVVAGVAATDKHAELHELGAASIVDRNDDPVAAFGHDAFDVVLDVVGGERWPNLLDMMRSGGRYAVAGAIAGPVVPLDLRTLYLKDQRLLGCTVLDNGVFAALVERIERGEVRPLVASTFPLSQIVAAQELFLTKQHVGKIVLTVGDSG